MASSRDLDLVVFGATGFVGRLLAEHLAERRAGRRAHRARWPLRGAARGGPRRLPGRAREWPLVVADASDAASLTALAAPHEVVATTVGPYARYGMPLVGACAARGHRLRRPDRRGAVRARQHRRRHEDALRRGARIVHSCGFDSVPSDLGVLLLAEQVRGRRRGRARRDHAGRRVVRGGFSGGTIDSVRGQVDAVAQGPERPPAGRRPVRAEPRPGRRADPAGGADAPARATRARGRWTAPFVMAPFNTRIVRRSNALQRLRVRPGLPLPGGDERRRAHRWRRCWRPA